MFITAIRTLPAWFENGDPKCAREKPRVLFVTLISHGKQGANGANGFLHIFCIFRFPFFGLFNAFSTIWIFSRSLKVLFAFWNLAKNIFIFPVFFSIFSFFSA